MAVLSAGNGGYPHIMTAEFANTPGSHIPFTRAIAIWPVMDFLDTVGAPTESFLQKAGIPLASLEQPESLLPLHLVYSFFEHAANAEGINNLGLLVAQQTSAYDMGIFGEMLREALTVHEYLHTGLQMIGSLTSGAKFWLTSEGNQMRVGQYLPGSEAPGFRHADLYTIAITLRMLRSFTHNQWSPEEVYLHGSSELKINNDNLFWGTPTIKGQAHSSFTIPKTLLQQAIPLRATEVQQQQERLGNSQSAMPDGLANAVKQVITLLLQDGCPDIHLAAEAAGMSTRTFQRRLSNIGTSYSKLLQRTRMQLAAQSLVHTTTPVNEIAASLGYRDPANFTRAFRLKTGVSPRNYRVQAQNSP